MFWFLGLLLAYADQPTKLPLNHVRGKQLYDELCFQCHGEKALAESDLAQKTQTPALAGRISSEDYPNAIAVIQEGRGRMPAYEMLVDKHDSKRILMYLSRLDPETGLDPKPDDYIEAEEELNEKRNKGTKVEGNDIGKPLSKEPTIKANTATEKESSPKQEEE